MMHTAKHSPAATIALSNWTNDAQRRFLMNSFLAFLALACIALTPSLAHAADNPLTLTICTVVKWFTGQLGRSIATLGVIVLAIGALMGKVSWGMAITVAAGIAVMFSGDAVVAKLTGESTAATVCDGVTSTDAYALSDTLCKLAGVAGSATGRALATLAVCFIGIGALFGKISAPAVILVTAGIGAIINADDIVAKALNPDNLGGAACSPVAL